MTFVSPNFDLPALDAFIFDLDGVIWRGHTPIAGAVESVMALRAAGKKCFYATNNSRLTQGQFADRLRAIGLGLRDEDVVSSSAATAWFLETQFQKFTAYVIGEEGIRSALQHIGGEIIDDEAAQSTLKVDVVVVGIDRFFSYQRLQWAQKFLLAGARFVATNTDATFPVEGGVVPGAGSIVAAVQTAVGIAPTVIGKPQPAMLQGCVARFGLSPHTTAMVGDRLDTDIACGHRAGLRSIFVATGVHTWQQAKAAAGDEKPDALFDDLPALCRVVLSAK